MTQCLFALSPAFSLRRCIYSLCLRLSAGDKVTLGVDDLHAQAVEWAATRGARSGRVAWQFIQDLAGRLGVKLA